MPSRFHCPRLLEPGAAFALPTDVAHHAVRVLRLRLGECVHVFDGSGTEFRGELIEVDGEVGVALSEKIEVLSEAPLRVTLVQALAVADKMDWIVQKAVELGAQKVQPVDAERSVLKLTGDRGIKRVDRWRQIAVGAAEQSGRNHLCEIGDICSFSDWLANHSSESRWILTPEGGSRLSAMPRPEGNVSILIGPEGGWSENEVAQALAAGCSPVQLGPRVLRTETAGLAAIAAMMSLWGDF